MVLSVEEIVYQQFVKRRTTYHTQRVSGLPDLITINQGVEGVRFLHLLVLASTFYRIWN